VQPDANIGSSPESPIVDFDSLVSNDTPPDTVVDLSSLVVADIQRKQGFNLGAIRAKAPNLQITARFSLPLMVLLYFSAIPAPPLLVPLALIILVGVIFLIHQLYIYRRTRQPDLTKNIMISASQLDVVTAHLAWLFDPMIPAPMMMLVAIAAIGNGLQHGVRTFRSLF